ncbi:Wadjet anti-phage system protein JetD domain-containing protein [Solobacterium moorei]|mgnify:FL=1|uniref:Wadjet anti-phage system protein JetD domain-containing protein n=1 Tax=Solobacterium moorei TaxID=102148 RepID=UPI0023F33ED9|nr:Wadjet anti-phage system protein JetD domain-containing protein [Solobacterium moorei]
MNKYEIKIVNALLKKYYKRKAIHKDAEINRRIDLPATKILKDYSDYNVNLNEKELVNKAIISLEEYGFITVSKLKLSEDFEKIYLCVDNVESLEEYAAKNLDIIPRSFAVDELKSIIKKYRNKGEIVNYYIDELENTIQNRSIRLDVMKEEDILKIITFLENNKEFLYIREVSMLIFGDSKYLENYRKTQVCSILYSYYVKNGEDVFREENLLERFNVYDIDQEICIKGPVLIGFENKTIDIDGLTGGVSFSIKDIDKIKRIVVNSDRVMTIENKTSFLRMNQGDCYIYLGGFATKPQVTFIKKLIENNPDKRYLHFGDIDAGGFWIHKKLCEQTNMKFDLFCMDKKTLQNDNYKDYVKSLTENDVVRLTNLKDNSEYQECIEWILKNNFKLEQEIVSLKMFGY